MASLSLSFREKPNAVYAAFNPPHVTSSRQRDNSDVIDGSAIYRHWLKIPKELSQRPAYDPAIPNSRKRPSTAMGVIFDNFPSVKRRIINPAPTNLGV
ncbi:hypothetical protein AVEN_10403-1 [Araneus ventricosus]|uniref:Uncharacterized protein n=1 Tax=Araneus ventricosus TaxID=182803 RepID=A0A4Y2QV62_ARAVE|nr:hypothetical protein AVEN_10403-1 [Araneus ventricosus]